MVYLLVPYFRKGVHNDAKDDVQTNCGEDDEEDHMEQSQVAEPLKVVGFLIERHHL